MHQEPVYVYPHRTSPVSLFREPVPVHVVAWYGRNVLIRQAEAVVLQGVDQALCPCLVRNASVKWSREVRTEVHSYRGAIGDVVVQVCAAILVPKFLVDSLLRLLRQFFVGRRVFAQHPRYLREISVSLT